MTNDDIFSPLDFDEEVTACDTPASVLIDAITEQFDNAFEERKRDYVRTYITKYKTLKDQQYEDELEDLENERDLFFSSLLNIFEEKLGIGFPDFGELEESDQDDIIHFTYTFFIKKIKRNFKNIVLNYINNHKDEISNKYSKKKDVTFLNFKNEISDEYDLLILCNLVPIVEDALYYANNIDTVDDFFDMCEGDSELMELTFVREKFANFEITGNFINNYAHMVNDSTHEILAKVKKTILDKYPNRSIDKNSVDKDNDNNEENDEEESSDNTEE